MGTGFMTWEQYEKSRDDLPLCDLHWRKKAGDKLVGIEECAECFKESSSYYPNPMPDYEGAD